MLLNLPYELLLKICGYLLGDEILTLSSVFKQLADDWYIWSITAETELHFPKSQFQKTGKTACQRYKQIRDVVSQNVSVKLTLKDAIRNNDVEAAEIILPYVDILDQGNTFLFNVIYQNRIEIVRLLFDDRINVAISDALISALNYGYTEMAKLLLNDNRIDPSLQSNKALGISSANGYYEIVHLLLQNDRLNLADGDGNAILMASSNGHVSIVNLLLKHPQIKEDCLTNCLSVASIMGHTDIVKILLEDGRANAAEHNNAAIIKASQYGHSDIVKMLLQDAKVDPAACNNRALISASENGHAETIKVLLMDKRVNPADQYNKALMRASEKGHVEIVKILLTDRRVDAVACNNLAFRLASKMGHIENVELLLSFGYHNEAINSACCEGTRRRFNT